MGKVAKCSIVFFLLFCINNNLFSQEGKSWIEIDSYDGLEGEWEGNAVSQIQNTYNETEFVSKLNITITFNYKKGDENVSSIIKIDFTDFLTDLENTKEVNETGFTKEDMWDELRNTFTGTPIKFDRYSLVLESTEPADEYFASDSNGRFLMNKNKDMLLLIYYEPSFIIGIGDLGFTKMIFRKALKVI
jgi:hypothetical protein